MNDRVPGPGTCNLCLSASHRVLATRDRHGQPLRTVLCEDCGLVRSDPLPDPAALDRYYRQSYRLDYKAQWVPSRRHVLRAGRVGLARIERLPQLPSGARRALDIGSGGGEFAYLLQGCTGLAVTGIEPNEGYAGHARERLGLEIHVGPLFEAAPGDGAFDLITLYHVLEHLHDPSAALAAVARWLAPGGLAVVEVPDVEATCQAPGHLFHFAHLYNFNGATLERIGAKAGLEPLQCWRSADGGNVSVTFRKPVVDARAAADAQAGGGRTPGTAAVPLAMPSNAMRVAQVRQRHTALRHYLSWRPVARLFRRLAGRAGESIEVRRLPADARVILDRLLAAHGTRRAPAGGAAIAN